MRLSLHIVSVLLITLAGSLACGGKSSGDGFEHSATGGVSNGGSGNVAPDGGVAGVSVGGSFSSSTGQSSEIGGNVSAGGTTSTPNVVVENGAPCSPVAARGCSSESIVAQMVCSDGNVWQWASDCALGTVCDPRPGLKVGSCVAPDGRCGSKLGVVCDSTYGELVTCESPGFVTSTEQCLSATCADGDSCQPWDPCSNAWKTSETDFEIDCSGMCGIGGGLCATPSGKSTSGLSYIASCAYRTAVAVPPSASLPTVEACPSVRVFWVWEEDVQSGGCRQTRDVHLPKAYSMVIVSRSAAVTNQARAEASACNLSADYVSPTQFTPSADEAVLIVTDDANAPGFKLIID